MSRTRSHPGAALAVGAACVVIVAGTYVATRDDGESRDPSAESPLPSATEDVPDGANPGPNLDAAELVDRVDATLSPDVTRHVYELPEDPAQCPRLTEVSLTLTGPEGQPLRVDLLQDGTSAPLDSAIAAPGQPAVVALPADAACDGRDDVSVAVAVVAQPLGYDVAYALERFDSR